MEAGSEPADSMEADSEVVDSMAVDSMVADSEAVAEGSAAEGAASAAAGGKNIRLHALVQTLHRIVLLSPRVQTTQKRTHMLQSLTS